MPKTNIGKKQIINNNNNAFNAFVVVKKLIKMCMYTGNPILSKTDEKNWQITRKQHSPTALNYKHFFYFLKVKQ